LSPQHDTQGQLGTGTAGGSTALPELVNLPIGLRAVQLAVGNAHACARMSDGSVWCWGANAYFQSGVEILADIPTPTNVDLPSAAVEIAAGGDHTCAIVDAPIGGDTRVVCWGDNRNLQLGLGDNPPPFALPSPVAGLLTASKLGLGESHSCAIKGNSGDVLCWGNNVDKQVGDDPRTLVPSPALAFPSLSAIAVSGGGAHTCALSAARQVRCCSTAGSSPSPTSWGRGTAARSPPTAPRHAGARAPPASSATAARRPPTSRPRGTRTTPTSSSSRSPAEA
jgi:alpha-tubulin suppressor-like RCC1 family protein